MEEKIIMIDQIKRDKNSINNKNIKIDLGYIDFEVSIFLSSIQNKISKVNSQNVINIIDENCFTSPIKIVPKFKLNNEFLSKSLFISFCKFIRDSIPNFIQNEEDKVLATKSDTESEISKYINSLHIISGYISFALFAHTNESKIYVKPSIQLNNEDFIPYNLALKYYEEIKNNLPVLLDNFIKSVEIKK